MFPLFATGVVDTGDKFAAGVIDIGGKLATGINKASKNYGKFAAGDVDTGGKFAAGVVDTLNCEYLREFLKYDTVLLYCGTGGKLFHEKN